MRVRITRGARGELRAAARYYEDQRDGLGVEFQGEIRRSIQLIADNPEIGSIVPQMPRDWTARQFLARRFPYFVIYEVESLGVLILAIAHARREPLYWVSREDT